MKRCSSCSSSGEELVCLIILDSVILLDSRSVLERYEPWRIRSIEAHADLEDNTVDVNPKHSAEENCIDDPEFDE